MKKLVSIIIPVYNVKDYLTDCLDSVINQSYRNLEIILIDDGSTDGSSIICDKFLEKDKRIKVVHKKNEGLSVARNMGILISQGSYLYFLDSDDYISLDTIEILVNICESTKKQIGITEYKMFKDVIKKNDDNEKKCIELLNTKEAIETMLLPGKYDHCACAKLYDRKLWEDKVFPKGKLYEDLYIIYDIFKQANGAVYYNIPKYYYRTRDDSIMNSKIKMKDVELLDIVDMVQDKICDWYPDMCEIALNFKMMTYANFMIRVLNSGKREYYSVINRIVAECKTNFDKCIRSNSMRTNDKIKIFIISKNYHLYPIFYKIGLYMNKIV